MIRPSLIKFWSKKRAAQTDRQTDNLGITNNCPREEHKSSLPTAFVWLSAKLRLWRGRRGCRQALGLSEWPSHGPSWPCRLQGSLLASTFSLRDARRWPGGGSRAGRRPRRRPSREPPPDHRLAFPTRLARVILRWMLSLRFFHSADPVDTWRLVGGAKLNNGPDNIAD